MNTSTHTNNYNEDTISILNANESTQLIDRLPLFELSYETISHKKVSSPKYDVCLAIPQSKKFYAWFTFLRDTNACYIMELTRDKKIGNINVVNMGKIPEGIALGTLLYGSMISGSSTGGSSMITGSSTGSSSMITGSSTGSSSTGTSSMITGSSTNNSFLIEDIFFYNGISLRNTTFGHKLGFIYKFIQQTATSSNHTQVQFHLPQMMGIPKTYYTDNIESLDNDIIAELSKKTTYPIHHLQYRSLTTICPFLNVFSNKSTISNSINAPSISVQSPIFPDTIIDTVKLYVPDFSKPQYNYKTVFRVCADLQYDIYHLYAYGKNCELVYYDIAYISNYKTSVFMNNLFRKIKENHNLDYIEESEDEADFEDIRYDKYVDLNKELFIECSFHKKFKKWVPLRLIHAHEAKVVHISKLQGTVGSHYASRR